ncbi:MAG: ribonuclease HII [Candidatus Nanoarchaeia archaeon]|nr:ribonuclease HII [Candidatus Nanoarchaeia archaeon]
MKVVGIDEAGRGPVIGPLVIVGSMIEESKMDKLKELGVKDSKLITPKKRQILYKKILELTENHILIIEPKEIDEVLESDTLNLNWLEAIKSAEIINVLKPEKAILDCPSPNIKAYEDYVRKHLIDKATPLHCEHKADVNHVIVGAASILAKVTRDNIIEELKKKYGDFGPGYSSNPITQKYVEANFEKHPEIFRRTWATWKNHDNKKNQKNLDEF